LSIFFCLSLGCVGSGGSFIFFFLPEAKALGNLTPTGHYAGALEWCPELLGVELQTSGVPAGEPI
jgi:hypothetical protein